MGISDQALDELVRFHAPHADWCPRDPCRCWKSQALALLEVQLAREAAATLPVDGVR